MSCVDAFDCDAPVRIWSVWWSPRLRFDKKCPKVRQLGKAVPTDGANSFPRLSRPFLATNENIVGIEATPTIRATNCFRPVRKDDSLDLNITLELPLPDQPLGVRLRHALREQNSALTITDGLIRIVSLDDVDSDPQYLMTLVYDVTHLRSSPNALIELAQNSIQTEEWLDTGSGLGLSLIHI